MYIHGHAIVSANDCIADKHGHLPKSLMNDADWQQFQHHLDQADLIVLGHKSHLATPNIRKRRRLILSRTIQGLEERADGYWWNPDRMSWSEVLLRLPGPKSKIAVPGGQGAFDLFLTIGFTAFYLARSHQVYLPDGQSLFSHLLGNKSADEVLRRAGLMPTTPDVLDVVAQVSLTVYR